MILACPHCETRYEVDAAKFPTGGRAVRCAKCGHTWLHIPYADQVEVAPQLAPPIEKTGAERVTPAEPQKARREERQAEAAGSEEEPATPAQGAAASSTPEAAAEIVPTFLSARKTRRIGLTAGWVVLALAIIFVGWAGVHFRREVATAWPQSASLYRQFGLKVRPKGIELVSVRNRVETERGVHVLVVSGTLFNDSSRELSVPQIRVALSKGRHELYQWPIVPGLPVLKPGQSAPFRAKLANPPSGAEDVQVSFDGADD